MLRVKDPARTLDFYTRVIGMRLLSRLDFNDMKFSLYFMGFQVCVLLLLKRNTTPAAIRASTMLLRTL